MTFSSSVRVLRVIALFAAPLMLASFVACSDDASPDGNGNFIGSDARSDAKASGSTDAKANGTDAKAGSDGAAVASDASSSATDSGSGSVVDSGSGGGTSDSGSGTPSTPCSRAGFVCRMGDFTSPCNNGSIPMTLYSCGAVYPGACCSF